ncbi:MAG: hypothetical protein ACWGO1_09770, partial [Anaerolineales bacterium]
MVKILLVLISIVLLTSTACALGAMIATPSDPTPTPISDISQEVAAIVSGLLTQTALPAANTPVPATSTPPSVSASANTFQNSSLGIQFIYPKSWHIQDLTTSQPPAVILSSFDPASPPHKLEWNEQTVSMQIQLVPTSSMPDSLEGWVVAARQEASESHLSIFEEKGFLIANQPAVRLTLVSGSGGILHQVLTVLNGQPYKILIEGNLDLANDVLSTVQDISDGVKPADSDTPAAGICSNVQGDIADIILGNDPSGLPISGRCMVISPDQRLRLTNQSNEPYNTIFAGYKI